MGWPKFGCKFSSKWLSFGCHLTVGTLNQIAGKKKDPMTTNKSKDAKLENKGVSEPSATELDDQKNAKEVTQMAEAIAKALNEAAVRDHQLSCQTTPDLQEKPRAR